MNAGKLRGVAARPSVNAKARNKKLQKRLKNKRNKMINSLVHQLKNGELKEKEKATGELCNLAYNETNQKMIVDAGAVSLLVGLLSNGTSNCKELSAVTLCNLV